MIEKPNIAFIQNFKAPKIPFRYGRHPIPNRKTPRVDWMHYSPVSLHGLASTAHDKYPAKIDYTHPQPTPINSLSTQHSALHSKKISGFIIGENTPVQHRSDHSPAHVKKDILYSVLQEKYPWLPVIKEKDLDDDILRNNFIQRALALQELNYLRENKLTRHALIDFHSRYKLLLLAHSQPAYREIGPFVALIHKWNNLEAFFIAYRTKLMAILQLPTSRENHTNVLMHIQGYFRPQLSSGQRGELSCAIDSYRTGMSSIDIPLKILKKYLSTYPNRYLTSQKYLMLEGDSI